MATQNTLTIKYDDIQYHDLEKDILDYDQVKFLVSKNDAKRITRVWDKYNQYALQSASRPSGVKTFFFGLAWLFSQAHLDFTQERLSRIARLYVSPPKKLGRVELKEKGNGICILFRGP